MQTILRLAISCAVTATSTVATATITFAQPPQPSAPKPTPEAKPSPESITKAEQILAEARKALGGDKLAGIKTLTATGRTRRVRGNNLVPIEFEILLELPDKYVRVDESPAEDADPTSSGFNGDALIQVPPPPAVPPMGRGATAPGGGAPAGSPGATPSAGAAPTPGGTPPGSAATPPSAPAGSAPSGATAPPPEAAGAKPGGPPATGPGGGRGPAPDPRRARIMSVKQDYARLALGLFAASPAYPVTFSYAAVAEAPQGQADVLDVKGEGNLALRYFIDSKTRLPIMVTWNTPPTNVIVTVPGQPPPKTVAPGAVVVAGPPAPAPGAPKEETDKYAKDVLAVRSKAQAAPVEHRLYFADYREVDGLRLPFRLRRAIGTETTEETTFDRFRLNSKIDPRKFEVGK